MQIVRPGAETFRFPYPIAPAPRRSTIVGSRIGLIDNGFASIGTIHAHLLEQLVGSGAEAGTVVTKRFWRDLPSDCLDELALGSDAVLTGLSTTPPSTYATVSDCIGLEGSGIPTVCFVASPYVGLLESASRAGGAPDLHRVVVPYPIEGASDEALRSLAERVLPFVVGALTEESGPLAIRVDWGEGEEWQ